MAGSSVEDSPSTDKFSRFNVQPEVPTYDAEMYEKHLNHQEWTKDETDYLVDVYRECNGKWPVIIDHYAFGEGQARSMEELKSRFYGISATLLQQRTPITSMTAPEYTLFETLSNFNPTQEASRKQLAEGHLFRKQQEVDEESVLLTELQRIMVNQATMEAEREVCMNTIFLLYLFANEVDRTCEADLTILKQTPMDINTQHPKR
jgi:DNA methyltransferase 1-associated protein 1